MKSESAPVAGIPVGTLIWASLHFAAILFWYELRQTYTPKGAPCFGLGDIVSETALFYLPLALGLIAAGIPLVLLQVRRGRTLRQSRMSTWLVVVSLWVVAAIVPYRVHVIKCNFGSEIHPRTHVQA
jgi:hypothetical protein